jgi:dihydrofolate reductase
MSGLHATMNISLDACCEHTQVIADEEFHEQMCDLFATAAALLFGRNTYALLQGYWPKVASSGTGTPAEVRLARILNDKPKHVVSSVEPAPGWSAVRMDGNIDAIRALKERTGGTLLLVASPTLARALVQWALVDEYHVAISPMVAGHGPTFLAGVTRHVATTLLHATRLRSGVVIHRYGFALFTDHTRT